MRYSLLLSSLLLGAATRAGAQSAPRTWQFGVSAAAGVTLGNSSVPGADGRGGHILLAADVSHGAARPRLRAEAMLAGYSQQHGPLALGLSILYPLLRGDLRPYVIGGAGIYGVGGVGHYAGISGGVGIEAAVGHRAAFVEVRAHTQASAAVAVGLRF